MTSEYYHIACRGVCACILCEVSDCAASFARLRARLRAAQTKPLRELARHPLDHDAGTALDQRRQPPRHLDTAVDRDARPGRVRAGRYAKRRRRPHPCPADIVLALSRDLALVR